MGNFITETFQQNEKLTNPKISTFPPEREANFAADGQIAPITAAIAAAENPQKSRSKTIRRLFSKDSPAPDESSDEYLTYEGEHYAV